MKSEREVLRTHFKRTKGLRHFWNITNSCFQILELSHGDLLAHTETLLQEFVMFVRQSLMDCYCSELSVSLQPMEKMPHQPPFNMSELSETSGQGTAGESTLSRISAEALIRHHCSVLAVFILRLTSHQTMIDLQFTQQSTPKQGYVTTLSARSNTVFTSVDKEHQHESIK